MKVVWELGSATVKDVCNAEPFNKPTAYSTVLTFMRILEKKGVLSHTESGRTYVYTPLLTRKQAIRNHIRDMADRFFDGDPAGLIEEILSGGFKSDSRHKAIADYPELQTTSKIA